MIVYFDTSAIVKRYIKETGSREVNALLNDENTIPGSVIITQVEMAAALQKSIYVTNASAKILPVIWQDFMNDWKLFTRIQISTDMIEKASQIALTHKLRGYDSLHLAAALLWQESLKESITLATFDRDLWFAGQKAGTKVWPEGLVEVK